MGGPRRESKAEALASEAMEAARAEGWLNAAAYAFGRGDSEAAAKLRKRGAKLFGEHWPLASCPEGETE